MMEHKGYVATVEFDPSDDTFYGRVVNTRTVLDFEGKSVVELKKSLVDTVEYYLESCRSEGTDPEKPYSGTMVLRGTPELHRAVALAAARSGMSMNEWLTGVVSQELTHGKG